MAIEGWTGRPGAGKTASAVQLLWEVKKRGKPVFANIPLIDRRQRRGRRYHFFGELASGPVNEDTFGKSWSDGLLEKMDEVLLLDNAVVLLDEVHMWMPSHEWDKMPFMLRRYLAQQRKIGIDIWWTSQSNSRVFNVVRELTGVMWHCERVGPLVTQHGKDPLDGSDMGKRWVMLSPALWELFDTEFMVGDALGQIAGQRGYNARYHRANGTAGPQEDEQAVKRHLVRQELPGGRVVYRFEDRPVKAVEAVAVPAEESAAVAERPAAAPQVPTFTFSIEAGLP